MNFTLISFGTVYAIKYRKGLNKIRKKCRSLGIPYYLKLIDPVTFLRPGRLKALLYKPTFIKEMLYGFNNNILWFDADCEILTKFDFPEGDWDVGVLPHQLLKNRIHFTPWVVSFILFRPTNRTKKLLNIWEHFCQWTDFPCTDHERFIWAIAVMSSSFVEDKIRVQNLLPYLREKICLDPQSKKQSKLTYKEISSEFDSWYPTEVKLPDNNKVMSLIMKYMTKVD